MKAVATFVDSLAVKAVARFSLALSIPLLMWSLTVLKNMHDDLTTLKAQFIERTSDKYTGSDAIKDGKNYLDLIARNQADIAEIAKRQMELEKYLYQNMHRKH